MIESRNPFRMQTSEQIENVDIFLKLFEPQVVDLLPKENLWNRVTIIRSSPGGGKTTLLRLFTTDSLISLYNYRNDDPFKDFFIKMKGFGALDENGPKILGILLNCGRKYNSLEDLEFNEKLKEKLLLSLLDARIILAGLKGILQINQLNYPKDLDKITFTPPSRLLKPPFEIEKKYFGQDLYEWAKTIEKTIYSAIDSFQPSSLDFDSFSDTLVSPFLFKSNIMSCNNEPIPPNFLVMLDECHELTVRQREILYNFIKLRMPAGIWIAERLESLPTEELLSEGFRPGRDTNAINLESYWRESKSKFKTISSEIAEKRARESSTEINTFSGSLHQEFTITQKRQLQSICDQLIKKINDKGEIVKKYAKILNTIDKTINDNLDKAIALRTLEIVIEKDLRDNQKTLSDYSAESSMLLSEEADSHCIEESDIKAAAELFLKYEYDLPYYFGSNRLSLVASNNIEQYVALAGDLYQEIISQKLLKSESQLNPNLQEKTLKKSIKARWDAIPLNVKNGRDSMRFLQAIGKMAEIETKKSTAPYAPGVTGIGILMRDREKLIDNFSSYKKLSSVISECLRNNLLEVRIGQKCKGKEWMILYLNRMLCVQFDLPLQYGGWKEKNLDELSNWVENGYSPKQNGKKGAL